MADSDSIIDRYLGEYITKTSLVDKLMPVGHIITTVNPDFNPNATYDGTYWEKISDGIFLESNSTPNIEKEAGLPDITGTMELGLGASPYSTVFGAFSYDSSEFTKYASGTDRWPKGYSALYFSANRSNNIYGKYDTYDTETFTFSMNQTIVASSGNMRKFEYTTDVPKDRLVLIPLNIPLAAFDVLTNEYFSINENYTNYWTLGSSQPIYITAFIKSKDGNNLYRILDINVNTSNSNAAVTNVNKTITVTNDISHGKVQPHSLTVIMWKRTA